MHLVTWLLGLVALAYPIHALHFYLDSSEQRCFLEELPSDTIVEGHYKALEWVEDAKEWRINNDMGVQVTVEEVKSGTTVADVKGKPEGKFTFTSHDPGDHTICLKSSSHSGYFTTTHIKFYLDINVGALRHDPAQDTSHMSTLATKLRDLNEKIDGIRREQQYQREIEAVFRDASERVNKRAMWWSFLQMAVLLGAGAWQMRHLKVFFEDKKLR
ncbi:emp24p/erv25p- protein [Naganishia albida]|nr:emp24p/erv25p- protein [Naganishia albida]